jgi:hypothetical protein
MAGDLRVDVPVVRRLFATAVLLFLASEAAFACPVCFQVEDSAAAQGVRAAVLVLVGVTVTVLSGFGAFVWRFWRRSQRP